MSLTVRPRVDRGRRLGPVGLSAQLRAATRQEHADAESAFDLEARLRDLAAYRLLLETLQGFYLPVEAALARVRGGRRLPVPVDVAAHRQGDLLAQDLRRLAAAPHLTPPHLTPPHPTPPHPSRGPARPTELPVLGSPAPALGTLYVLAGSALGGQVIARRARASLGDGLPVAFFSSAGRPGPQHSWRALQAALDAFGTTAGADERDETVKAARQTFQALTGRLDARG